MREVIRQVSHGHVPGVPSAHVIRLTPAGSLTVEGPVAADARGVTRAAQLLDSILPPFDATGEFKVPGALRLVIARALGTLDVPSYETLDAFDQALQRFSVPDTPAVIRQVIDRASPAAKPVAAPIPAVRDSMPAEATPVSVEHEWRVPSDEAVVEGSVDRSSSAIARREPAPLTVSDVRRARRATGLSLTEIAERSRVPVPLLRQLEWGYLENWPAGLYGRSQLVRYARAAGLDEQVVMTAVWPMLAERARQEDEVVEAAAVMPVLDRREPVSAGPVSAGDVVLDAGAPPMIVESSPLPEVRPAGPRRAAAAAAMLAAAALVTMLVWPGVMDDPATPLTLPTGSSADTTAGDTPAVADRSADRPLPPASGETEVPVSAPAEMPATGRTEAAAPAAEPPAEALAVATSSAAEEGAAPVRGLSGAETTWSPAFASVGSAMFYHAQAGRQGESDVVRAETDGEGTVLRITRVVDDHAQNFHARPSPDGTRIAFDSDREGERAVYVADSDGSNVRRVSGEGFAAVPSWSPDGQTLAFVRAESSRPNVWNLWLVHLPTGEFRRLTSYRVGQPWGGSWFPDGRRIAYSHEDRLVILNLETGEDQVFPSPRKGRLVRTPAVAPDGSRIIFQVYRDGAWLLDVADGSMRKVLADPTAEEYAWSPDGRRVAYHSRRSGQWGVWLMASR